MNITLQENISLQTWLDSLQEFQLDNYFDTSVLGRSFLLISNIEITTQTDTSISANIIGSNKYELSLESSDKTIVGACSCPYTGSCKHLAALILKLI